MASGATRIYCIPPPSPLVQPFFHKQNVSTELLVPWEGHSLSGHQIFRIKRDFYHFPRLPLVFHASQRPKFFLAFQNPISHRFLSKKIFSIQMGSFFIICPHHVYHGKLESGKEKWGSWAFCIPSPDLKGSPHPLPSGIGKQSSWWSRAVIPHPYCIFKKRFI